jgi:hypothetical protein
MERLPSQKVHLPVEWQDEEMTHCLDLLSVVQSIQKQHSAMALLMIQACPL